MRDTRETTRDRRAILKGIGVAIFAGPASGVAGAVERARATGSRGTGSQGNGSRAAAQEVDTSLPPGAVLFDLDGDGAYDATVERAPESLADDVHPNPIRITSGGLATVDYAASVVEPDGRPALGDLDRLAYDYRVGPGDGNGGGGRAFGAASGGAVAGQNETTDRGGSDDGDQTTEGDGEADSGETTESGDPGDGTETAGPGDEADGGDEGNDGGGSDDGDGADSGGGNDGSGSDEGGNDGGAGNGGDAAVPDETFIVVETDDGRHGAYLTYHDEGGAEGWRTHDVLARITGDTAGTSGWFEYTADDEETFDDAVARFGADARLVRVGVGRGDGVTPTALDAVYGGLVVNDERYRFPVEVARRSGRAPFRG